MRALIRLSALLGLLACAPGAMAACDAPASGPVVLINVFDAPQDHVEEAIAFWERAKAVMAVQPGYLETSLHRALSADARFQLINIAKWESVAAFEAALNALRATPNLDPVPGLRGNPALYRACEAANAR